jgi:hypothetical protein
VDSTDKPNNVIYVRMNDEVGAALYEQITNIRMDELKSQKQFILMCIAEHLAYDHNEVASAILEYLKTPRIGRPKGLTN